MIDRRAMVLGAAAAAALPGVAVLAASEHPAVARMRAVAADLIATQRAGSPEAYYRMITRHADVPAIALYALGHYQSEMKRSQRDSFFRGVGMFIARYFADQGRNYQVASAEISPSVRTDADDVLVHSTVTLTSGASYRVVWRLDASGHRIRDVQVLGFSLRYLQRSIFQSYISRRGGTFQALYAALTQ